MEEKRDWEEQHYIDSFYEPAHPMPARWADAAPWPELLLQACLRFETEWRRILQSVWLETGEIEPLRDLMIGARPMSEDEMTSAGPDCEDDGAAFLYDPTNGTFSSGDIFMPR